MQCLYKYTKCSLQYNTNKQHFHAYTNTKSVHYSIIQTSNISMPIQIQKCSLQYNTNKQHFHAYTDTKSVHYSIIQTNNISLPIQIQKCSLQYNTNKTTFPCLYKCTKCYTCIYQWQYEKKQPNYTHIVV